ncbi:MAG: VOC family protein [Alphaproteobacteria bacterium]|nr:VOC family protein [Alphaproteobacteria bacterium]
MPLEHLQHVLIQTTDLEGTKDWWVEVLGLEVGPHPDFRVPVYWLYLNGHDVVHVTTGGKDVSENRKRYLGQESEATWGSGVVDHIAFHATGLRDMMAALDARGIEYRQRQVSDQNLYQLFLTDPNGVKLELNFPAEEAAGLKAELTAEDLD